MAEAASRWWRMVEDGEKYLVVGEERTDNEVVLVAAQNRYLVVRRRRREGLPEVATDW